MEKYLVVGTGISGLAAAKLLLKKDKDIVLFDGKADLDVEKVKANHPEVASVEFILGELPDERIIEFSCAVLSPGVPCDLPMVNKLRDAGVEISGEIELAYSLGKGSVCAITGTNGKTTTTTLLGDIMKNYFDDVRVVGNIGIPYTSEVLTTTDKSVIVAEISSFQLETANTFAPKVSAILNITPDHLNRHHTMEAYIEAKENITINQSPDDTCVLNYEDEVLRDFGKTLKCKVIYFSSERELQDGFYLKNNAIYWGDMRIVKTKDLQIIGSHNYENAMAAAAMAAAFGVPMDVIVRTLREFTAVAHRIEFVCEKRGVKFYNDSKGTNPDAAIKGILAMQGPTCLIGGGYDKESTYDEWIDSFNGKVKKFVLIGQTKEKIAECCKKHDFFDFEFANSLEEAIDMCYEVAKAGDNVLLSPACASWGMFDNYEQRGDVFKDYVRALEEA